jgi:predicted N-acetyltransferase YhbS
LSSTPHEDIYVFTAHDRGEIIAGAFFSRLVFANDPRSVFILSQMAVVTDRHGQGIGQTLQKQALARCVTTALLWR